MIEDPLFYLVVERIKHLSSSGINLEEIDYQLNILDQVLFSTSQQDRYNYEYSNSENSNHIHKLINYYLYLNQEDYQSIGMEANIWFFELIYNHMARRRDCELTISIDIRRLAYLYVIQEHPYCRYFLMMIYLELSDKNPDFKFDNFLDQVWTCYKKQNEDYISEANERYERNLLREELETIVNDLNMNRRSEDY